MNYAIISHDHDDSHEEIQWGRYIDADLLPYMISNECVVIAIYNKNKLLYSELDDSELLEVIEEVDSLLLTETLVERFFYNEEEESLKREEEYWDNRMDAERLGE